MDNSTNTKKILLSKAKFAQKQTFFGATISHLLLYHFFPLLFPKDSKSLKILDIRLQEVGAKRCLSGTSKVNRRTNGQKDKFTYRKADALKTIVKHP